MKLVYLTGIMLLALSCAAQAQTALETVEFLSKPVLYDDATRQVVTSTDKTIQSKYPVNGNFQNGFYSHRVETLNNCLYKITFFSTIDSTAKVSTLDFTKFDPDLLNSEKPDFLGLAWVRLPGARHCKNVQDNPDNCVAEYKFLGTSSSLKKIAKAVRHMAKFCTPRAF